MRFNRLIAAHVLFWLMCNLSYAMSHCQPEGAFGIRFGDHVPWTANKLSGGAASTWYTYTPSEADPQFDSYEIRVDTATSEIFEVRAIKQITPKPGLSDPPASSEVRETGAKKASAFARDYIKRIPEELRREVKQNKFGTENWQLWITDHVLLEIFASFAWDVAVSCKDTKREWIMGRRVLPELFKKDKKD